MDSVGVLFCITVFTFDFENRRQAKSVTYGILERDINIQDKIENSVGLLFGCIHFEWEISQSAACSLAGFVLAAVVVGVELKQ